MPAATAKDWIAILEEQLKQSGHWGYFRPLSARNINDILKFPNQLGIISIGSEGGNNFVLKGPKIEKYHCYVVLRDRKVYLSSKVHNSHTFLKGREIRHGKEERLKHGDDVLIGEKAFIFGRIGKPPFCLEDYEFGPMLGKGTFGKVYDVLNKKNQKHYAMKVVQIARDPEDPGKIKLKAQQNLKQEVKNMASLRHKNICKLYQTFYDDAGKSIGIVMELVKGGKDLWKLMSLYKNGIEDKDVVRDLSYQLCDAVDYIHSRGIVHRDIKPQNMLLVEVADKKIPLLKLTDFGLSTFQEDDTGLKSVCGTPLFAAPEVVQRNYDERADNFSVGVTLYYMLTGGPPFVKREGDVPRDLFNKVMGRKLCLDGLKRQGESSLEAYKIIERLLRSKPNRRASAKDVMESEWLRGLKPCHGRETRAPGLDVDILCPFPASLSEVQEQDEDGDSVMEDVAGPVVAPPYPPPIIATRGPSIWNRTREN